MIRKLIAKLFSTNAKSEQNDTSQNSEEFVWSLVGNIVDEHEFGEQKETRRGTKHFSPGTKVHCIPEFGGTGHERITAIGIARRSNKHIKVVLPSILIVNWRTKKVFHPYILSLLTNNWHWKNDEKSKKETEEFAKSFIEHPRR